MTYDEMVWSPVWSGRFMQEKGRRIMISQKYPIAPNTCCFIMHTLKWVWLLLTGLQTIELTKSVLFCKLYKILRHWSSRNHHGKHENG